MNRESIQYKRQCAVNKAWKNEYQNVLDSKGSRNWSQKEQKEILSTGKCHGYEGQHMLSVKAHPEHAGNPDNIQFLTHKEHLNAHRGNWHNDANGRYNLKTGKIERFSDGKPKVHYKRLTDPISNRSKTIAQNKYKNNNTLKTIAVHKKELPVKRSTYAKSNSMEEKRLQFNRQISSKGKTSVNSNSKNNSVRRTNTVSNKKSH